MQSPYYSSRPKHSRRLLRRRRRDSFYDAFSKALEPRGTNVLDKSKQSTTPLKIDTQPQNQSEKGMTVLKVADLATKNEKKVRFAVDPDPKQPTPLQPEGNDHDRQDTTFSEILTLDKVTEMIEASSGLMKSDVNNLKKWYDALRKVVISQTHSLAKRDYIRNVYAVSSIRQPVYVDISKDNPTVDHYIEKNERVLLCGGILVDKGTDTTWRAVKRVYDNGDVGFFYTAFTKKNKMLFHSFSA